MNGVLGKKTAVESIRKNVQETDMTIGLTYINKHASHHTATGTIAKVPTNQLEKLASLQPEKHSGMLEYLQTLTPICHQFNPLAEQSPRGILTAIQA